MMLTHTFIFYTRDIKSDLNLKKSTLALLSFHENRFNKQTKIHLKLEKRHNRHNISKHKTTQWQPGSDMTPPPAHTHTHTHSHTHALTQKHTHTRTYVRQGICHSPTGLSHRETDSWDSWWHTARLLPSHPTTLFYSILSMVQRFTKVHSYGPQWSSICREKNQNKTDRISLPADRGMNWSTSPF